MSNLFTLSQSNSLPFNSESYITQGFVSPNGGPSTFINQSLDPQDPQHFTTDYYAGNQVCIFLGGLWISDVTSIQFQLNQGKTPFWGYKSQLYDTVAKGTKLVQGVFSVNFIDAHYINMAVAHYKDKKDASSTHPSSVRPIDVTNITSQVQANPATIDPYVEDILTQYWWNQAQNSKNANALSPDNLPRFDITLTYGGYPARQFGAQDEFISSHTVKVIEGVEILNHQQMLAITGEPVQEIYTFLARDISSPITRPVAQLVTPAGTGASTK